MELESYSSSNQVIFFLKIELKYSKLEYQYSKPTPFSFLFFSSHIIVTTSLSLSMLTFLTLALLPHLDSSSLVPRLPQSLISLSASSSLLFALPPCHPLPLAQRMTASPLTAMTSSSTPLENKASSLFFTLRICEIL